jgi:hypothetical protein
VPDQPQLDWKCRPRGKSKDRRRSNTDRFLVAARAIYTLLCKATGEPPRWESHETFIRIALEGATGGEGDCLHDWKELFPAQTFRYDPLEWRRAALRGDDHRWDGLEKAADFGKLRFEARDDLKWFLFHFEAKDHRLRVIRNVPEDLE